MNLKGIHVLLRELSLILLHELTPIIHQKNYKTLNKTYDDLSGLLKKH